MLCQWQLYEFPDHDQGRVVSCRMQAKAGSNSLILANFQVELVHFIAGKLSCILAIKTPNIFSVPWQQSDDGGEEPILPKELLDGGGQHQQDHHFCRHCHRRHHYCRHFYLFTGGGQHLQDLVRGPEVVGHNVDEAGSSPPHRGSMEPCQVEEVLS